MTTNQVTVEVTRVNRKHSNAKFGQVVQYVDAKAGDLCLNETAAKVMELQLETEGPRKGQCYTIDTERDLKGEIGNGFFLLKEHERASNEVEEVVEKKPTTRKTTKKS